MSDARNRLMRSYAPNLLPRPRAAQEQPVEQPVEQLVEQQTAEAPKNDYIGKGVMIALYPAPAVAEALALPEGEPTGELHVTLAFLGLAEDLGLERAPELDEVVTAWAATEAVLEGEIAGAGLFTAGERPVTYASVDVPGLSSARERLIQALDQAGFEVNLTHGYTPHITLDYGFRPEAFSDAGVPNLPLLFEGAVTVFGGDRFGAPFGAGVQAEAEQAAPTIARATTRAESIIERVLPEAEEAHASVPAAKAFVTQAANRTLITGPAETFVPTWEKALNDHPHMLWLQGRFVGAEKANRNNAFWATEDLQMGHPSVAHGPLNWLHEDRHIIGTIAESKLINVASREQAAEVSEPHIVAASAIWRWIYPDEAWVVEQANDLGQLWYSMECISRAVECVGENGCGAEVSYANYINGLACSHLRERSATKRLVDPTFLGGAVIVPPTRPGWADSDARLLQKASSMAEKAFEQAGSPDIPASTWEAMMTSVVRYAEGQA